MTKYYFIPIELELDLSQLIDYWVNRQKEGIYTVVTGVYKEGTVLNTNDSTVYSINILQETQYIKYGFQSEDIIHKLIGFCLEADFDLIEPSFAHVFDLYPTVVICNSADEFIKYIDDLQILTLNIS